VGVGESSGYLILLRHLLRIVAAEVASAWLAASQRRLHLPGWHAAATQPRNLGLF
jgi:hypothetical protein